jgi:hypothetical protein
MSVSAEIYRSSTTLTFPALRPSYFLLCDFSNCACDYLFITPLGCVELSKWDFCRAHMICLIATANGGPASV